MLLARGRETGLCSDWGHSGWNGLRLSGVAGAEHDMNNRAGEVVDGVRRRSYSLVVARLQGRVAGMCWALTSCVVVVDTVVAADVAADVAVGAVVRSVARSPLCP